MINSVFAATAALSMSAGAALAGPYVNVESNASWSGDDYVGVGTCKGSACGHRQSSSCREYRFEH